MTFVGFHPWLLPGIVYSCRFTPWFCRSRSSLERRTTTGALMTWSRWTWVERSSSPNGRRFAYATWQKKNREWGLVEEWSGPWEWGRFSFVFFFSLKMPFRWFAILRRPLHEAGLYLFKVDWAISLPRRRPKELSSCTYSWKRWKRSLLWKGLKHFGRGASNSQTQSNYFENERNMISLFSFKRAIFTVGLFSMFFHMFLRPDLSDVDWFLLRWGFLFGEPVLRPLGILHWTGQLRTLLLGLRPFLLPATLELPTFQEAKPSQWRFATQGASREGGTVLASGGIFRFDWACSSWRVYGGSSDHNINSSIRTIWNGLIPICLRCFSTKCRHTDACGISGYCHLGGACAKCLERDPGCSPDPKLWDNVYSWASWGTGLVTARRTRALKVSRMKILLFLNVFESDYFSHKLQGFEHLLTLEA